MKTHHHPDDSTLVSYAAGGLSGNARILIECHLSYCSQCRETVRKAESIGASLLDSMPEYQLPTRSRDAIAKMLDAGPAASLPDKLSPKSDSEVPAPLHPFIGDSFADLKWSPLVPGVGQVRFTAGGGELRLLNIAPGTCLPMHSHRDTELTMVLTGSYSDEIGRFGVGDVADLDPSVEHQPIVDSSEPCISLVVSDAPLKFSGIVPRMLQPFFGI